MSTKMLKMCFNLIEIEIYKIIVINKGIILIYIIEIINKIIIKD